MPCKALGSPCKHLWLSNGGRFYSKADCRFVFALVAFIIRKSTNWFYPLKALKKSCLYPHHRCIYRGMSEAHHQTIYPVDGTSITVVGVSIDFAKSATAPIFLSRLFSVENRLVDKVAVLQLYTPLCNSFRCYPSARAVYALRPTSMCFSLRNLSAKNVSNSLPKSPGKQFFGCNLRKLASIFSKSCSRASRKYKPQSHSVYENQKYNRRKYIFRFYFCYQQKRNIYSPDFF